MHESSTHSHDAPSTLRTTSSYPGPHAPPAFWYMDSALSLGAAAWPSALLLTWEAVESGRGVSVHAARIDRSGVQWGLVCSGEGCDRGWVYPTHAPSLLNLPHVAGGVVLGVLAHLLAASEESRVGVAGVRERDGRGEQRDGRHLGHLRRDRGIGGRVNRDDAARGGGAGAPGHGGGTREERVGGDGEHRRFVVRWIGRRVSASTGKASRGKVLIGGGDVPNLRAFLCVGRARG